jgi:tRNA threonylcarbamoyladenosine biosynthesis protein TsaB
VTAAAYAALSAGPGQRPANALGIDTSTAATAVCVLRADGETFETVPAPSALQGPPAHARELMPGVARQMEAAGLELGQLDHVAVGVGPGAYTGLRIGIATARALAQAHRLPIRPVGSLEALAEAIEARTALAVIDARRREVFATLRVAGGQGWPPYVTRPEELVERVVARRHEGLEAPLAVGDGSLRFRDVLEAASIEVAPAESRLHVVRALHVCRLAARAAAEPPETVLPRYLRAPDAIPAR